MAITPRTAFKTPQSGIPGTAASVQLWLPMTAKLPDFIAVPGVTQWKEKTCDSQLARPVTFLRQSHSFFRESFSIFCFSPSWTGGPLSAFFPHCCTLSCKLKLAEHHGKPALFGVFPSLNNTRRWMIFTSGVSLALFSSQLANCQGCEGRNPSPSTQPCTWHWHICRDATIADYLDPFCKELQLRAITRGHRQTQVTKQGPLLSATWFCSHPPLLAGRIWTRHFGKHSRNQHKSTVTWFWQVRLAVLNHHCSGTVITLVLRWSWF